MNSILVDSDVLIEFLRQRDHNILSRWTELIDADALLLYSPVTAAEIWRGARDNERRDIERLFAAMLCVPIDGEIGRVAGDCLRKYSRSHGLEIADALIAAAATVHNLRLWTRNRKHYPMPDLQLF